MLLRSILLFIKSQFLLKQISIKGYSNLLSRNIISAILQTILDQYQPSKPGSMERRNMFVLLCIITLCCIGMLSSCSGDEDDKPAELPLPKITSVSPAKGKEGDVVTINGNNFSPDATTVTVGFNGVKATEIFFSSVSQISTQVPTGATTGNVSVTIGNQTVQGPVFTVEEKVIDNTNQTPVNFKIAFIGDSEVDVAADAVLSLIKSEGTDAVVHAGDLGYDSNAPLIFENNVNAVLGADFPYFYVVGNHDDHLWNISGGYQQLLESRFNRLGIKWTGQLGVQSSFSYKGIFFVTTAPDEFGITSAEAGDFIRGQLKGSSSLWRISFWHKNQRLMQIGGKVDEAGWHVYEESRKGGAIIATAHEHSYSRTYEMSNFQTQTISSTSNIVNLAKDDLATAYDEGRSFAFVSGLGGRSIRDAQAGLDLNPWWADVYHSNNGGQYGALFGEFNYNGDARLARFYFKDIDGVERDEFFVRSNLQ